MKKLFAIVLVFALLMPLCITAQADEVEKAPYYMSNWVSPIVDCDYVYGAPFMHASFNAGMQNIDNGIFDARIQYIPGGTIEEMAEGLKDLFDTYPDGTRYISFSALATTIHRRADICFAEDVPAMASKWLDAFLKEYKRIGGKLDGLNIDIEYLYIYAYYIQTEYFVKDDTTYSKIEANPAYAAKIRPQLVERGFKFYDKVTEKTPELYALHTNSGSAYAKSREIWDIVMRNYMADIVEESCAPLFTYYPDAMLSDYRGIDTKGWINAGTGGNRNATGNAGNEMFYSVRPDANFFQNGTVPIYSTVKGYADAEYANSIFNRMMYDVNVAKGVYQSSETKRLNWVTGHQYYHEQYAYSPYYPETMFHLGLLNPEVFLGYILQQDCRTDGDNDVEKFEKSLHTADDIMEELTRVAGYADRKVIALDVDWNHGFVMSGMYAGGRNIWRITPDDNLVTLEDFKVSDSDPTFKVGDETVTFPGGKIIEDGNISDVGTYGYWVETAANVTPVITRANDYYRNNTGYQETYENYAVGTEYTYGNALPEGCWQVKKQGSGSSAVVIADPTNAAKKVLELKGNVTLTNLQMPANIHGGDSYAEHQAWEVTLTLPADLSADAELILLNASNEKKATKDGGFKVTGGKVYYSNATEYLELTGVTLSAGATYTFIREMDFTTADAFTSTYSVYGADGVLLGQAKNVETDKLVLPVYSVGFSVKGVTGSPVLADNFRLYQTKVNADFFLYDSVTGMKYDEIDKPQSGDVAYRFSWLNATNEEKSYTVMAAYYDGDTKVSEEVVKEFKLAPNTDNIDFGVVENKQEGKKLLVYLKDNNPAEGTDAPEAPANPGATAPTTPAAPTEEPADNSKMIIIIAATAVVVIAVVVVVVVASKKKKKAAPAEPVAEEKPQETPEE